MGKMTPKGGPQSAWLWGNLLLICCVVETGCVVATTPKKGVGTSHFPHVAGAIVDINVSWYYNWKPHTMRITQPRGVEFVPMIWDETFVEPKQLDLAKKSGTVLLGFNEPDHVAQANMTVQQALDLWPHLMATGMPLCSPATAADPSSPGSWLEQFMESANARGYRVDFVCVHWYGETFDPDRAVYTLKSFLQAIYRKFQLPIWLTEYSLIRWPDPPIYPSWKQQAEFASKSVAMLESLPFVERYAWFSLHPWTEDGRDTISLSYQDGSLTPAGLAYKRGPATALSNVGTVATGVQDEGWLDR
jgi:hypothetical protein